MNCVDTALKRIETMFDELGVPDETKREQLFDIRRKLERQWRHRIVEERMAKERIGRRAAALREGIKPRTAFDDDAKIRAKNGK